MANWPICALPLDENIRQIETGFDVVIRRRNERFSILGEKARLTADAIRHFYAMFAGAAIGR